MKLFLKEHALLIAVQLVQFTIMALIYWLDGYRNWLLMLYTVLIGSFLLVCYLLYHYFSRRGFYQMLSDPLQLLEDSLRKTEHTPISEALHRILKEQYRHYQYKIKTLEDGQLEHLKFMDRWVHQMKTPLSIIELTARDLDEPESSDIREETERMKTGLNTILYMARLRTIEQDFHVKPIMLSKVVAEVNQENKRFYIRNEVYPRLHEEKPGIVVETDEKWLLFILMQVVNNAVKYSAGQSKRILISIYERNGSAVLEVKDYGVGIPEADKRRVFNAFFTGDNGRKFRESTGMGLYLVKEAAEHLGHQIEMESRVGEGTVFRIIFPPEQIITSM